MYEDTLGDRTDNMINPHDGSGRPRTRTKLQQPLSKRPGWSCHNTTAFNTVETPLRKCVFLAAGGRQEVSTQLESKAGLPGALSRERWFRKKFWRPESNKSSREPCCLLDAWMCETKEQKQIRNSGAGAYLPATLSTQHRALLCVGSPHPPACLSPSSRLRNWHVLSHLVNVYGISDWWVEDINV